MPAPLAIAGATCLALAVASLALPSGPTYDPYAWLIWGRDLAHLGLSVNGTGTSWKPLPALIDALLTPLGHGAADAWLVIARAGAIFAVFMAARLAWRLAPRGMGLPAAAVAAASLTLTHLWVRQNGLGYSEGLMVALGLLAIDRHLDGHRAQAFALLVAAGLIRIEMWPFVVAYGLWMAWRGSTRTRFAVALGALMIPLFWFGGDWLGSGHFTTAAARAVQPKPGAPATAADPALAVAEEALLIQPLPVWIAVVAGLVAALVRPRGTRVRVTPVVALAGCALAWTTIVAVMATRGYLGLPRFLFMASALNAVAAGIGAAIVARGLAPQRNRIAGAAAGLLACAAFALGAIPDARLLPGDAASIDHVADMDAGLARSVQAAGGAAGVMRCGSPTTPWYIVTALAWDLNLPAQDVHDRVRGTRPVVFAPKHGHWRVSEASRCRLVASKPA
jgi:hypothetical protein